MMRGLTATRSVRKTRQCDPRDLAIAALEAGAHRERWPEFLRLFANAIGGHQPGVFLTHPTRFRGTLSETLDSDPKWEDRYQRYYITRDPRRPLITRQRAGSVFTGLRLLPYAEFRRSEFYTDFLYRQGMHDMLGAVVSRHGEDIGVVRILRGPRDSPFGEREMAIVHSLLPALQTAFDVHARLSGYAALDTVATTLIDSLHIGVILLRSDTTIVAMNAYASGVVEAGVALRSFKGKLVMRDRKATEQLRQFAMVAAGASVPRTPIRWPAILRLQRGLMSERAPVCLQVVPVPQAPQNRDEQVTALAFVTDPELTGDLDEDALVELMGIRLSEAKAARTLLSDPTAKGVAARLNRAVGTIEKSLERIYETTDVVGKSQLVERIVTLMMPRAARSR